MAKLLAHHCRQTPSLPTHHHNPHHPANISYQPRLARLLGSDPGEGAARPSAPAAGAPSQITQRLELLSQGLDSDDDRSQLSEEDQGELLAQEVEAATAATTGNSQGADVAREKALLTEMEKVAEQARGLPDARVRYLLDWICRKMCPGVAMPSQASPQPGAKWNDNDPADEFAPAVLAGVVYSEEGRGAFPTLQREHGQLNGEKLVKLANQIPIKGGNLK